MSAVICVSDYCECSVFINEGLNFLSVLSINAVVKPRVYLLQYYSRSIHLCTNAHTYKHTYLHTYICIHTYT